MPRIRILLLFALFQWALVSHAWASILFVDSTAGGGEGLSWATAHNNLATAIVRANPGDEIWVAGGVYSPGTARTDTFQLKDGVAIYGGFAGDEDPASFALDQRDMSLHETILEGEIGAPGAADNLFHVVTATNVSRSAVLDGFTIAHGNASGLTAMLQDAGGAMLLVNASPTIRHCLIRDSQAGSRGGAVHMAGGAPYFVHCRFVANRTTVTQAANNLGGGLYYAGTASTEANPTFVNCLFVGNRAGVGNGGTGGAIYGGSFGRATIVNCTFLHNRADTLTAGVFGTATLTNCILYGNQDHNGFDATAQLRGTITVSHSLVQGGWSGAGNVNADPLLANALGADGIAGTLDDDVRLRPGSPCIDAGSNLAWPEGTPFIDLDGAPRFLNDPATADSGEPPGLAIIDMGAYEKQSPCTDSTQCDDGLYCNGDEFCQGGTCQPGAPPGCADNVECTIDRCVEAQRACAHEPDDRVCDDGVYCNGLESCDRAFGCLAAPPPDCDDGVACTIDACDAALDACTHAVSDAACDDAVFCNGTETCDAALGCSAGADPCDDGVTCTVDACDETSGQCQHQAEDSRCDDGAYCNGSETCGTGGCGAGLPPCTAGQTCDETLRQCTDPPPQNGVCSVDSDCSDGNLCTDDRCEQGACGHVFSTHPCDDANSCTSGDVCTQGACVGTPIPGCGEPPPGSGPDAPDPPTVNQPVGNENEELPDDPVEPGPGDGEAPHPNPGPPGDDPDPQPPPLCPPGEPCNDVSGDSDDADEDGVPDEQDQCPGTAGGMEVDEAGCPPDDPEVGRGTWTLENQRRCGACGSLGAIGVVAMFCVPATVLITGRPRGREIHRR